MIRFACKCGYRFELPDDEAGGVVQCMQCGILSDVPNHSDRLSINPDGTYVLDAGRPVGEDPGRMAEIQLVYAKTKVDAEGNEIDLRTLPAGRRLHSGEAGEGGDDEELELKPTDKFETSERLPPRYDPETGELVRPLDFRRDPDREIDPASIPMAKAAINYASGNLARRVSPVRAMTELFKPMNLVVMSFVFLMHLFNAGVFVAAVGLLFVWPVLLLLQFLILGHYGNVIDDVGRNEQDDLPRPMRDLGFHEDLWSPFVQMFGGLMIAYVPPIAVASYLPGPSGIWMALALGIGTVLAPAILLTTNTSGATNNLRPDRVLAVVRVSGVHYVIAVIIWAITWPVYVVGWFGLCLALTRSFDVRRLFGLDLNRLGPFVEWVVVLPALGAGVYLMHYFMWYLGLMYRSHHDQFPWVLQRHIRDPNKSRPHRTHADQLGRKGRRVAPVTRDSIPPARVVPVGTPRAGVAVQGAQTGRAAPVGPKVRDSRSAS